MNKLILLLALFANTCFSHAQSSGTIRGVIHDSTTGEPILYAKVIVSNTDSVAVGGAYSDLDGFFSVRNLAGGAYYLTIEEIEHEVEIVSEVELDSNRVVTLRVLMHQKEQVIGPIILREGIHCGGPKKIDSTSVIKAIPSGRK